MLHTVRILATFAFLISGCALAVAATPSATTTSPAPATTTADAGSMAAAQAFYKDLVAGKVDRAKLSDDLNQALTDNVLQTISSQFTSLGQPTWAFQGITDSPNGKISTYQLTYPNKTILLYNFGATAAGTIFNVLFSPPAKK